MTATRPARVISYLFHPLLIPAYILLLLLNTGSLMLFSIPLPFKLLLAGIVVLITILFPLFMTWMFYRLGFISSFYMERREERVYPIMVITVFYYLTYFLLNGVRISTIFSYYMLGATLLALLALMINFYRKISLHMIGIGSFTGFFIGISLKLGMNLYAEIFTGILLGGGIGYARLALSTHQPGEIYSGFLLGVVVMTAVMLLL